MARNLKDDEERNKRVLEVAEYVIKTGASTRQTAKYFTENKYSISNATVNDYLRNRLPKLNKELAIEVDKILKANTPKTVEVVEVRKRIYQAVSLLFQDYTISEIAKELNSTFDIIYDDLTIRLPKIEDRPDVLKRVREFLSSKDSSISEDVKSVLQRHKTENLANQHGNKPYFDKKYFEENEVVRNSDGTFQSFSTKK